MKRGQYEFLLELLSQPTAPFREQFVIRAVESALTRHRTPFFADPAGNIVVGCASAGAYRRLLQRRDSDPVRIFVAHMDHPGFHGVRWIAPRRLRVRWYGGSPVRHLTDAPVWLASDAGVMGEGRLERVRLNRERWAIDSADVRLPPAFDRPLPRATQVFGGFAFAAPVWRAGNRLYTRAADDLIGVFAVVCAAMEQFRPGRRPASFIGLLTRAEEVGFIGAVAHFDLGWLAAARRPLVCISLEASRTLPGAFVGKGPVVRLGDRRTVFDPDGLKVLADVARKTLGAHHQRRIMDGGTCEATTATVYGLPAIGISVPLGNYHNQGFEKSPGSRRRGTRTRKTVWPPHGPAPEFVSLRDVDGLLALCRALLRPGLPWPCPWQPQQKLYARKLRRYHRLLDRF